MQENAHKFSVSTPIDQDEAIQSLGGEPSIFMMMLGQMESMSLNRSMTEIKNAFNENDYKKIFENAHLLKGAAGYVGASHLYYACHFIEQHYRDS